MKNFIASISRPNLMSISSHGNEDARRGFGLLRISFLYEEK
jgi:hypothetical protein